MRTLVCLAVMLLAVVADAQTTQPAKLVDLFKPYETRILARIAELPNVPTQAQMDACRKECDAIGDEFEAAVRLKYVWYAGFVNSDGRSLRFFKGPLQSSPREVAMGQGHNVDRPPLFSVSHSKPLGKSRGNMVIVEGQITYCTVTTYLQHDKIKSGPTTQPTTVGYPCLSVYLQDGNEIPMTAQIP